jgi:hypothetical protein
VTRWPNSSMISSAVSASMDWFCVTIMPFCISALTTSATRSAMRLASSDTTIVSGTLTSRTTFSRSCAPPMAFCRARSCLRFIAASDFCRPPSPPASAWFSVSLPDRRPSSRPLPRPGRYGHRSPCAARGAARLAGRRRAGGLSCGRRGGASAGALAAASSAACARLFLFLGLSGPLRARVVRVPWPRPRRGGACALPRGPFPRPRAWPLVGLTGLGGLQRLQRRSISSSEMPAGRLEVSSGLGGVFPPGARGGCGARLRHDDALALGFHHDVLGAPVAEALLHIPRAGATTKAQGFLPSYRSSGLLPFPADRPPSVRAGLSALRLLYNTLRKSASTQAPHVSHFVARRPNPIHPPSASL